MRSLGPILAAQAKTAAAATVVRPAIAPNGTSSTVDSQAPIDESEPEAPPPDVIHPLGDAVSSATEDKAPALRTPREM